MTNKLNLQQPITFNVSQQMNADISLYIFIQSIRVSSTPNFRNVLTCILGECYLVLSTLLVVYMYQYIHHFLCRIMLINKNHPSGTTRLFLLYSLVGAIFRGHVGSCQSSRSTCLLPVALLSVEMIKEFLYKSSTHKPTGPRSVCVIRKHTKQEQIYGYKQPWGTDEAPREHTPHTFPSAYMPHTSKDILLPPHIWC